MGGVLEIGKIVTAIWLHRNWKSSPFLVKTYLSFATLVLMGITSMGIFGFLSRAHIEHETNTQRAVAMSETIDSKIQREQDFIERQKQQVANLENRSSKTADTARLDIDQETQKIKDITEQLNKDMQFEQSRISDEKKQLEELDAAVQALENSNGGLFSNKKKKLEELYKNQKTSRDLILANIEKYNSNISTFRNKANEKIKEIENKITEFRNRSNEKDTTTLPQIEQFSKNIADAHGRIDILEVEKIGFTDSARELEAEVGPVKYVAEAIADFTGKEFDISQAVRIVIIILVLVFDPLAILLVIAANISIEKYLPKSQPEYKQAKEHLYEINAKIKSSQKELDYNKKACKSMQQTIEDNQNCLSESEDELRCIKIEVENKNESLSNLKKEIKNTQSIEKEIKKSIKLIEEDLVNQKNQYDAEIKELKSLQQKLKEDQERFKVERGDLDKEKKDKFDQVKNAKKILEEKEKDIKLISSDLNKINKNIEQNKVKIQNQDKEIEQKEEMIEALKKSYQKAVDNSSVIDILKNTNINEICQKQEKGKLLSIKEGKRIHQFLIPENHCKLSNQYFHEIVNELKDVKNEDLEHEYKVSVKKFINYNVPKYNVLTT
jgi:chromosome segregation ATPase